MNVCLCCCLNRRNAVKAYIALAPPFGGAPGALAALTSGSVEGVLPKSILDKLTALPSACSPLLRRRALGWRSDHLSTLLLQTNS
jgi:hypothetical protein